MKKSADQKRIIRDNKMIPMFWKVITEKKNRILVVNTLSGEYRVLDK